MVLILLKNMDNFTSRSRHLQEIEKVGFSRILKKKPTITKVNKNQNIYITKNSNYKSQQRRCEDLLNAGVKEIYLHCLGSAIIRGLNLALSLVQNSNDTLTYAINTSTLHLIDEWHPLLDVGDISIQPRNNSAIHIKIARNSEYELSELVRWLGLTEFEIMINLSGLLVFTITLAFRISASIVKSGMDWFTIFSPLFCIDICNSYFCIIVGIRMYLDSENKRKALHRFMWSTYFLFLVAIFKYLLCLKLSGQTNLEYSEVFSPIFVLLQLIAVRACQLPNAV